MSYYLDANRFEELYQLTFTPSFTGFTPAVAEIPNGDGKVDAQKRYAHINKRTIPSAAKKIALEVIFEHYMLLALRDAADLKIPPAFMPSAQDSTLRLLEYPPGVGGAEHTDFDLFTINVYRSHPDLLVPGHVEVHCGELAEVVTEGRLTATPHHVLPHPTQTQRSAVFFVMPRLDAMLPGGLMVRDWLAERKARSRVYK